MAVMAGFFPPGCLVPVPGVGEMFVRDSGEEGGQKGTVLLLHGWFASADINWASCYHPLAGAGYRVLAIDHRGHGHGLRSTKPFRIDDCAEDAAALLRVLGVGPVFVVGYSMGGAIAQVLTYRHPELVRGLVLSATSQRWRQRRQKRAWRTMGFVGFGLRVFGKRIYSGLIARGRIRNEDIAAWLTSELLRHDPVALPEAGRELGRFDSTAWVADVNRPTTVIVTTRDDLVPPADQRALAAAIPDATEFEVAGNHYAVGVHPEYVPTLIKAVEHVRDRAEGARVEEAVGV